MTTTDAALSWLLSIDAICTSSPIPMSTSPDLTDWLHISPRTDSLATTQPTSEPATSSSPCFQDISASSRVNLPQEMDYSLNYLYDLSDISSTNISTASSTLLSPLAAPEVFNRHHRMMSLESTTQTLINTPSPLRSIPFLSPTGTAGHATQEETISSFSPPLTSSPGTKSFLNYFYDLAPSPSLLPPISISDVSPIVRAKKAQGVEVGLAKRSKKKKKTTRRHKHAKDSSYFVEKLWAAPVQASLLEAGLPFLEEASRCASPAFTALLSPCRLPLVHSVSNDSQVSIAQSTDDTAPVREVDLPGVLGTAFSTPQRGPLSIGSLSPLTPLSSSPDSPAPLKIILRPKRKLFPNSTPMRRSKRPRRSTIVESPLSSFSPTISTHSSPEYSPMEHHLTSIHTVRTFPDNIKISEDFPLFYRRFPASAYYQTSNVDPPQFISEVSHPGGTYNQPRGALDLYTPRFVKGKGIEKVGLCPICIEPHDRGGENKKLWFAMKFSAFKYYHLQYAHGISAFTGRPFSPPIDFRMMDRQNPGKKEKLSVQQGQCHKCSKWVAVEGIKDMESKVKELHWWKHAAACHQDSVLEGEGDYYEEDDILSTILSLKIGDA